MIYTVSANPALDLTLTVGAIEYDTVLRASAVRRDVAGKGFNVSIFLKTLGIENVAVAFVGGHTGQALEEGLHDLGIATDFVYVAGETRTNVVVREPDGGRHIKVNQPGAPVTPDDLEQFRARVLDRASAGDLWVLTGSLAPGLPTTFYGELIEILHNRGATVVLDSSGAALAQGCAMRPDWVKPNTVEATELTGQPVTTTAEAVQAVRAILDAGAQRVLLSMAAQGALVGDRAGIWQLQPPAVQVLTGVRAGDAAVAGAVWAMERGLTLPEIGCWAVTVGTVTAMHDALPSDPWADLKAMYDQIQVTHVSETLYPGSAPAPGDRVEDALPGSIARPG